MLYRYIFDNFLVRLDPEKVHHFSIGALRLTQRTALGRTILRLMSAGSMIDPKLNKKTRNSSTEKTAFSGYFPGRLGLAAGMDKDADCAPAWREFGFGFVEVGTVTPLPQPGNDKPRLWRLPQQRALRNSMGFNNKGARHMARSLRKLRATPESSSMIIGVNIGKNKTTPEEKAPKDYRKVTRLVAPWADFLVINVSSPNTPGLRDLQTISRLRPIIDAVKKEISTSSYRAVPVLVKIAPDLSDDQVIQIAKLANEMSLSGVVATNTTIAHNFQSGGISGEPLRQRALEVIKLLRKHLEPQRVIIGTGGISTIEQAKDFLDAGATLLEGFTAFIYEGPTWARKINEELGGIQINWPNK